VARIDNLAQEGLSRLGETNRGRPGFLLEGSLKRTIPVLSEMQSRSGEEGSPKRDLTGSHCSHSSSPCLSEGSSPEREKPLA